ncbi:MAG: hypothetical protein MUP76_07745 [Acidimicrobiia bacterium]|nr:hypothetical protein [Acidimicrobiia bacterium]
MGWTLMLAGGGLVLLAALLDIDARGTADGSAQRVLETAREFIGNLLAPAWPIGLAALGAGFVLWMWGVVALVRGKDSQPAEA